MRLMSHALERIQECEIQLQLYFQSMPLSSFTLIKSQILLIHWNHNQPSNL